MSEQSWQKQTDQPLYPDVLWSRPENKQLAGKLLIIGGNAHGFATVSEAYSQAVTAGIGECKAVVPDILKSVLGGQTFISDFATSSVSGGFARSSVSSLAAAANWSDATWLVGDFGRSSETALLLEQLVARDYRLALSGDALTFFSANPKEVFQRPNTLLLLSFEQVQKLSTSLIRHAAISTMGLVAFADFLQVLSLECAATLLVWHEGSALVADQGRVVSTKLAEITAGSFADCVVLWLQLPAKPLESVVTGLWLAKTAPKG